MRVLLDTDVLIDVSLRREPFYADSAALWTLVEDDQVEGLVSVISFTNVFYVVRKLSGQLKARRLLVTLRSIFKPVACDEQILAQAIDSDLKDFEDAIQYFSALHARVDCLVTRNVKDYPRDGRCLVVTPREFLAAWSYQ